MRRFGKLIGLREKLTAVMAAMAGIQVKLTEVPELDWPLLGSEELNEELKTLEQRLANMYAEAGSISGRASILIDDYCEEVS